MHFFLSLADGQMGKYGGRMLENALLRVQVIKKTKAVKLDNTSDCQIIRSSKRCLSTLFLASKIAD